MSYDPSLTFWSYLLVRTVLGVLTAARWINHDNDLDHDHDHDLDLDLDHDHDQNFHELPFAA